MSEQLIGLEASTDFPEALFNTLRAHTLQIDDKFGTPGHREIQTGELEIDERDGQHFYELSAVAGTSDGKLGLGLHALGQEFRLSEIAILRLEPTAALGYLREQIPNGERLVGAMTAEDRFEITYADGSVLLSVFWQYAVNSFYPDVKTQNEISLDVTDGEESYTIWREVLALDGSAHAASNSVPGPRRRDRRGRTERSAIRQAHMIGHITHILRQLQPPHLEAAEAA